MEKVIVSRIKNGGVTSGVVGTAVGRVYPFTKEGDKWTVNVFH